VYLQGNKLTDVDELTGVQFGGRLNLQENQITDLGGLVHLTTVYQLNLGFNPISDLTPLSQLKSVQQGFTLLGTLISDLDCLSNLESIGGTVYLLLMPNLHDLRGLNAVTSATKISVSRSVTERADYIGPSSSSWLCSGAASDVFRRSNVTHSGYETV
jgi:internalin A